MAVYEFTHPSPDYIPGPEVSPSPDYIPGPEVPPSPDYIPGPEVPPSPILSWPEVPPIARLPYLPRGAALTKDMIYEDETKEDEEEHPTPADSVPPIPSPPLPIPSPPPNSPTHIEIPESCLPLRKRVRFASPTPSHEVGESSTASAARQDKPAIADDPYSIAREDLYGFIDMVDVPPRCSTSRELDYDITDTCDDLVGAIDEITPTTLEGVNQRVTDLATIVE
ncbi:hypothetical protein Tco_0739459 [Tanacetum coccineum]